MRGKITGLRLVFLLLTVLAFGAAEAQQARYIYIQSENNQPYYVRLNGTTFSSSASGYLLIPQLSSGDYTIQLGFPRTNAEYGFHFQLGQEDRGFSLKLGVDNSWSLFDMVSFNSIKGSLVTSKPAEQATAESKAPEQKVPEQKAADPKVTEPKTVVETRQPVVTPAAATTEKKPSLNSLIRKIYEKAGNDGVDLVYVVSNGNKADTVVLFVPHLSK